jgi:hypothetical protein
MPQLVKESGYKEVLMGIGELLNVSFKEEGEEFFLVC